MPFPSSKRRRDSNSRPLEYESPPITTRPGLPPVHEFLTQNLSEIVILPSPQLIIRQFYDRNVLLFTFVFTPYFKDWKLQFN